MVTIILDDILPSHKYLIPDKLESINWFDLDQEHTYKKFCSSLLNIAGKYYNLSTAVGYELWTHNRNKLARHQDKDENLMIKTGELSFPLCSLVYYLEVSNLEGGELILDSGLVIKPRTNRLVIFPPAIFHRVNPYKGKRVSILLNPWNHQLCH